MVEDLGSSSGRDWTSEVTGFRTLLSERLNLKGQVNGEGVWGEALVRLVELSGDPDEEAASWPISGAPLGIVHNIPSGGVFPKATGENQRSEVERLAHLLALLVRQATTNPMRRTKQMQTACSNWRWTKGLLSGRQTEVTWKQKWGLWSHRP